MFWDIFRILHKYAIKYTTDFNQYSGLNWSGNVFVVSPKVKDCYKEIKKTGLIFSKSNKNDKKDRFQQQKLWDLWFNFGKEKFGGNSAMNLIYLQSPDNSEN